MEPEDNVETSAPVERMTEQDLRFNCLGMANNPAIEPKKVVERAEAYLAFIKGQERRDAEEKTEA